MTDEAKMYVNIGKEFVSHGTVQHGKSEYVREFDFRYSNRTALGVNDAERAETALKGIGGKRPHVPEA